MKKNKFMALILAAAMCFSLSATAFAVTGEDTTTAESAEQTTVEATTVENTSVEQTTAEAATKEDSSTENTTVTEETTKEPSKNDVIALIAKFLGTIDFAAMKDTLNDINEALGLPRIEHFTDIPAYADALYGKLEDMGLGYGDIINGITSSDFIKWLNNLIFGNNSRPTTTVKPDADVTDKNEAGKGDSESEIPDTGLALGATLAAVATLGGSSALAVLLGKRKNEE